MTEKQWFWWGIGELGEGTYVRRHYTPFPVAEKYAQIQTLKDLKLNEEPIEASPTGCYFKIDEATGEFYHDSQGCLTWSLDEDGSVYVDNDGKEYVAQSLPEFLSRIDAENRQWHIDFRHYLENQRFSLPFS